MLSVFLLFIYPIGLVNIDKRKRERGKEREEVSERIVCSLVTRFAAKFADWLLGCRIKLHIVAK